MNRLILALAAVALLVGGAYIKGRNDNAAQYALGELEREKAARITERNMQDAANAVAQGYQDKIAVLAANNNRLAAATRGLRTVIAARANNDSSAPNGGNGGPVYNALGQCIDRYSELAGIADGYAYQLIAMPAYARVVAPLE